MGKTGMDKSDIENILKSLAKERKLFWSEADFQFSFAWKLKETFDNAEIRLERAHDINEQGKRIYVDIWVKLDNKIYPIELKYKTRKYDAEDQSGEHIAVKDQIALDEGRFGYLKDIERIERIAHEDSFGRGFAIILTNDSHYYKECTRKKLPNDINFHIHEGAVKEAKTLVWQNNAKLTKKHGNITLKNSYTIHWETYNATDKKNGVFTYAITEIRKQAK